MADLNGTIAVVTGAGRGIGREIARHQARSGAKVAVLARTAGEIDETASLIGGEGGVAISFPVDLVDRRAVEHVLDRVASELGLLTWSSTTTAPFALSVRYGNVIRMSGGRMSRSICAVPSIPAVWWHRQCSPEEKAGSSTWSAGVRATVFQTGQAMPLAKRQSCVLPSASMIRRAAAAFWPSPSIRVWCARR